MARLVLRPEERQARILAVAGRVFSLKGYAATRMTDIAAEAGMAQGLVYRYFPSKEALFLALIEHAFSRLQEAISGLDALPLPDGEKLTYALKEMVARLEADEDFARRIVMLARTSDLDDAPSDVRQAAKALGDAPYRQISALIARGQASGQVLAGDPEEMALVFWSLVKGLALSRLSQGADFQAPDARLLSRIFSQAAA